MKVSISLKRAIQSAIILLMMVAVALVWPLKIIRPWQYVGSIDKESETIILNEGTIMQEFSVQEYGLSYISFYLYNEEKTDIEDGILIFRLFDDAMHKLEEKEILLEKISVPGICRIRIGSELQIGEKYYFSIENQDAELLFSMRDGVNLDVKYEYKTLFNKLQYALCALAVFLAGGLLIALTEFLLRRNTLYVKYDFGLRLSAGILVMGISLWGMWNVFPGMKFSENPIDILFYETGILLFMMFAIYGLFYRRQLSETDKPFLTDIESRFRNFLQSAAFAGVMLGGVRYLNAVNSYQQKLASNIVLCCFAAAIICSYEKKELCNWYNLAYLIPAIGAGIYYCIGYERETGSWSVAKGNAVSAVLWGLVILNTIRIILKSRMHKISWFYLALLVLFVEEMIRHRYTKPWPVAIAVYWGIFAVRVVYKGQVQKYLDNFSTGVLIHFVGISVYSVLYRPFHKYIYTRYSGVFHTVTMAAVYFTLVLVLAWLRFLDVYKKHHSLKKAWKELWVVGMAGAFLLLTISRTGIFAASFLCLLIWIVTSSVTFRDGLAGALKRLGILLGAVVSFFFIVFTACRITPAVVGKPFQYDFQLFIGSIKAGEDWDSQWFITVPHFLGIADTRMSYHGNDEEISESQENMGALKDYSNGRWERYQLYLKNLDWTGHADINLKFEDGRDAGHAHNVYLQIAHDFGIGEGIIFLVVCIWAGIRSVFYFAHRRQDILSLTAAAILGVYGVCGLVEWVYVPYIPTGFAFLFTLVLLIPAEMKKQEG